MFLIWNEMLHSEKSVLRTTATLEMGFSTIKLVTECIKLVWFDSFNPLCVCIGVKFAVKPLSYISQIVFPPLSLRACFLSVYSWFIDSLWFIDFIFNKDSNKIATFSIQWDHISLRSNNNGCCAEALVCWIKMRVEKKLAALISSQRSCQKHASQQQQQL